MVRGTREDFDTGEAELSSSLQNEVEFLGDDLRNPNLNYEAEQFLENEEEQPLTREKELPNPHLDSTRPKKLRNQSSNLYDLDPPRSKKNSSNSNSYSKFQSPRSKKLPPSPPDEHPLPPLPPGSVSSSTFPVPNSKDSFPIDFSDFESLPGFEKYSIIYQGEELYVDSNDWRSSTLLKIQIFTSFFVFILFGLAEQAVGALIPKLQEHYEINDAEVSLIFLCSVMGYVIMAILNEFTHKIFGIKGVAVMGCVSMTTGYLIISFKPPYPILLLCYIGNGIGCGSLDATLNGWMGNLVDSNQLLGIMHGCYGIGCMITPPLITTMLERKKNPWTWNQYYIVHSVVGSVTLLLLILVFRYETPLKYKFMLEMKNKRQVKSSDIDLDEFDMGIESASSDTSDPLDSTDESSGQSASFSETLKYPLVWVLSLILFIYVGGEVAFGSWIITFLLRIKKLSYKLSSYLATAFWSGLTVGRIGLGFVTAHYFKTELVANLVYIVCSFAGFLVFWLFAFTDLTAFLFVIVFVTGTAVGPIFPTTIVTSLKILPVKYHTAGIGFICALGGGGAAAVPFLIGLIAESSDLGLKSFPLIVAIMFGILTVMWLGVFKRYKKMYGNML